MTLTKFIERIPAMPDSEVTEALTHENFIVRARAVCEAANRRLDDPKTIGALQALKSDSTLFWNQYLIRDFALAALDILGVEEHRGENERIDALVDSQLHFV